MTMDFVPPRMHVGRNWTGHVTEDACPCPKQPCGLVDTEDTSPDCTQHPFGRSKTMRQGHPADACPGNPEDRWIVKVRRPGGGESVLSEPLGKDAAAAQADALNANYQTDDHYIEKFDPSQWGKGFSSEPKGTDDR